MFMDKIIVVICSSKDGYGAFAENCDGIYGAGDTVEECKKDFLKSIEEIKSMFPKKDWPAPLLGNYEIEWKME